jgi:hypothetical protein
MRYVRALRDNYTDGCLRYEGQCFWTGAEITPGVLLVIPTPEQAEVPAPSVPIAVTTREGSLPVRPALAVPVAQVADPNAPRPAAPADPNAPFPFDPNVVARMQREGAMNLDPAPRPEAGSPPPAVSMRMPETATPDTGADLFF